MPSHQPAKNRGGRPRRRDNPVRVVVMLPQMLADAVRRLSEEERRPLSTQVTVLLEAALAQRASGSPAHE